MMTVRGLVVKWSVQNVQRRKSGRVCGGGRSAPVHPYGRPNARPRSAARPPGFVQRTDMSVKAFGYHHMMYCVLPLWSFQVPFAFRFSVGGSSMRPTLFDAHAVQ